MTKKITATTGIYKFNKWFGRMGDLSGVFTATTAQIAGLIGREVRFGEVLGKHSNVRCTIEASDVRLVSDNPDFVRLFVEHDLATGTNPLNYLDNE